MKKSKDVPSEINTGFEKYLHSSLRLNRNLNMNAESSGVEIIELDGSNTSESEDEIRSIHEHAWCYSNVHRMEDNYNINKKAREKWRMRNKIHPGLPSKSTAYPCQEHRGVNSNRAYTGSINYVWDMAKTDTQSINTLNCFTIVKNDIEDSESSSDKENSIEITECGDVVLERTQLSNDENFKRTKCNNRLDSTRTILIYSFKNRSILSDDDNPPFESSEDSTSDSSYENLERALFEDKSVCKNRVHSPSPAPYIPRLDFFTAVTLPTVAEVVEPNQLSSENIKLHRNNAPNPLASDRYEENDKEDALDKRQKFDSHRPVSSNNIINWMALSPRNRVKEFNTLDPCEGSHVFKQNLISDAQKSKYNANRDVAIISTNISNVKTNIETHPDVYDATNDCNIIDDINNQFSIDEKGDHQKIKQLKKPQIRLDKIRANNIITDPIEKLNGDEWIGREDEHMDRPDLDMDASKNSNDDLNKPKQSNRCAGDRLFRRNMTLLRPVEWAEYLPITESMPSLHISLPSAMNEGKRSWFKRFIELVQRCIKCK